MCASIYVSGMKRVISHRSKLIIAIIGVTLVVSVISYFVYIKVKNQTAAIKVARANQACNTDVIGKKLKTNYKYFTSAKKDGLSQLMAQVKQLKNVDQSINCQYVLAKYAASKGDYLAAAKYYDKVLELQKNGSKWIDKDIGKDTPKGVASLSAFMKEEHARLVKNVNTVKLITPK